MYAPSPRPGVGMPIGRSASPIPGVPGPQQGGYYSQPPIGRPISRGPSPVPPGGMPGYGAPPPGPGVAQGYGQVPYGAPPIGRSISRGPSPAPPGAIGGAGAYSPGPITSPQMPGSTITQAAGGFQIEKRAKSPNPYGRPATTQPEPVGAYRDELVYREHVSALINAKDRQIAVGGRIPVDPAQISVFFRAKTGVTYSLDFPIDLGYTVPPAYDVLISACRPRPRLSSDYDTYGEREALSYPPTLPLTPTLDLANYPILDAVKSSLFPDLPPGQYLTAVRDSLDVVEHGSYISLYSPAQARKDQRVATVLVTLPVRYRGGAIIVRDAEGYREEKYPGSGGKGPEIDWVAFGAECSYAVESVLQGGMVLLSYGVYLRSFGPASSVGDTLVTPSDGFFDLLAPILNMSRGMSVGFYLSWDYAVDPAEVRADALIPQLKGADALLYDAFKFHKLSPELHWSAGGFIWPVDATLESFGDPEAAALTQTTNALRNTSISSPRPPYGAPGGPYGGGATFGAAAASRGTVPPVRGAFGPYPDPSHGAGYTTAEVDAIRSKVLASGGVPLVEAGVTLLTDYKSMPGAAGGVGVAAGAGGQQRVGKERVFYVNEAGELEKLVVNVLLVVYIP